MPSASIPTASDSREMMVINTQDARTYIDSPMATIHLIDAGGLVERTFSIYSSLLIAFSEFFKTAFGGSFSESDNLTVSLPDVNVEAFGWMVFWLHGGDFAQAMPPLISPLVFLEIYKVSDRLMMPALKNEVMDILRLKDIIKPSALLPLITMLTFYGILKTPLGEFLTESFAHCLNRQPDIWKNKNNVPMEGLHNLADNGDALLMVMEVIEKNGGKDWPNPTTLIGCWFHEHDDGKCCYINWGESAKRKRAVERGPRASVEHFKH